MQYRFVIAVCILLLACALSNAQATQEDPLDRVITELQAGRTEQAFAALDDVIKKYPNNPDAYLLRGSLKMQADPSQALSDFTKVIELKPDSGVAYNQRATLRLVNGDIGGALKDLDAAIVHNFKDDSVYHLRGQLRWQVGDLNAALSDLNEAIKLNPNNPGTYFTRGGVLLGLKEDDRALVDINYLISWYETEPSVSRPVPKPSVVKNAESESHPGRVDERKLKGFKVGIAQETTNFAPGDKEMAPMVAGAYVNRGLILSSRGNHVAALADADKALRTYPTNIAALYLRAQQYEYKGDLPAALADITKALQIKPKNGHLLVERGVILLLMGRDKEAQADFDVLLKSDHAHWQKRIDERIAAVRKILPSK